MAAMTLSTAKAIIREAREAVRHPGKFEGADAWMAALYESAWMGSEDDWAGGDGRTWCGLWILPWAEVDASQADDQDWFLLFRELRGATCVTLMESDDGFVSGGVHYGLWTDVAAGMHEIFDPGCAVCGDAMDDGGLELPNGDYVCSGCGAECALCGDVGLVSDGAVVVVDDETGEQGFVCWRCV